MDQKVESLNIANNRLSIPGFYNVFYYEDVNDLSLGAGNYSLSEKRINSLYGSFQFAFKNYLFLDFTGRNDWSSTLPAENNSYFYPSASLGLVVTDLLGMNSKILQFGKVRASYAKVGSDGDPYLTQVTYVQNGKPEQATSLELGMDLRG